MKFLVGLLILIFLPSLTLGTTVDAKMSFAKNTNGKKMYGTQWFAQHNVGIVTVGVVWKNFDAGQDGHGFDLSKAATARMERPQVYDGCEVKITGSLFAALDGNQVNTVSINFQGAACKATMDSFAYVNPARLIFTGVPTADGTGAPIEQLTLQVEGLPLTACGSEGSVGGRAADCAELNSTLNTKTSDDGTHKWSLVIYDEDWGPSWQDEVTQTVWGPELPGTFTEDTAVAECGRQPFLKSLPSKSDAEDALKDGYFSVILNGMEITRGTPGYWTSTDGVDASGQPGSYFFNSQGTNVFPKNSPYHVRCTAK